MAAPWAAIMQGAQKVKESSGNKKNAITGMAVGTGQMISGAIKKAKAERLRPSNVDPEQVALLEETRRKQRQIESGTDVLTQANIQEGEQNTAATQSGLSKVTGGNVGGTVSALLGAQKLGGQVANQTYGGAASRSTAFGQMAAEMSKEISQRKLELQMAAYGQKMAEAANMQKQGFGNFMGGMMSFNKSGNSSGGNSSSNTSGSDASSATGLMSLFTKK